VGDVASAGWKSNHINIELLKKRATVPVEEARSGRVSDWLFVGGIILGLVALAIGSAFLSLYLLYKITAILAGR
jgi:Zn-dependent membrane protease YugP